MCVHLPTVIELSISNQFSLGREEKVIYDILGTVASSDYSALSQTQVCL